MNQKIRLIVGNIYSTIEDPEDKVIPHFREIMRFKNDFFKRKASNFAIPEFTYLINKKGVFFTGIVNLAIKVLKELKEQNAIEDYEVVDQRRFTKHPNPDAALDFFFNLPIKPRDYQTEAFVKGLTKTRGIFDLPTSAGKTVILGGLIGAWSTLLNLNCVVILKSKTLCEQLRQELSEILKVDIKEIGYLGGGKNIIKQITVATVQTITSFRSSDLDKNKKMSDYLKSVDVIFIDEVHNATSDSYKKALTSCVNASVCFGLSATPMSSKFKVEEGKAKEDRDILLHSYVGPKIFRITTKQLAEKGYLSIPEIVMVNNKIDFDEVYLDFDEEYERFIIKSKARNKLICDIVYNHYIKGDSIIGFVVSIAHGKKIAKMLIDEYNVPPKDLRFVHGTSSDRTETIDNFKKGKLPIMFGTILNEGLNFMPNVGINISGNESEKYAKQRLGRVLRKPKSKETGDVDVNEVNKVTYYDFVDDGHFMFLKHSKLRREIYENEGHQIIDLNQEQVINYIEEKTKKEES